MVWTGNLRLGCYLEFVSLACYLVIHIHREALVSPLKIFQRIHLFTLVYHVSWVVLVSYPMFVRSCGCPNFHWNPFINRQRSPRDTEEYSQYDTQIAHIHIGGITMLLLRERACTWHNPPTDGKGLKGILPQLDEFCFTVAERKLKMYDGSEFHQWLIQFNTHQNDVYW
jgi:hypothetical protein